jgi:hypothetical protein
MSKFKTGDTLIVMWQIDGYLSNTDLSELGRVAFPATSLAFRLPTPVPQEWITKGVKPKDKNELTITVSLASDSSVNSDQQVGGVFGEEPDFQYTCANGLTCNLGAVNCACATRQTCANNGVCVLNICTPPATPAPTVATNLPCTQSTPSALGACATDPSSLFSCQCVGSSGLAPCGGSQQGTCQRCTAGQPFCACTAGGTCATANFRCLGSRCFPKHAGRRQLRVQVGRHLQRRVARVHQRHVPPVPGRPRDVQLRQRQHVPGLVGLQLVDQEVPARQLPGGHAQLPMHRSQDVQSVDAAVQRRAVCARGSAVCVDHQHATGDYARASVPARQRELQVQVGRHVQRSAAQVHQYVLPAIVHARRRRLPVRVAQRHACLHVADAQMHDGNDKHL